MQDQNRHFLGVYAATATAFNEDLSVAYERVVEHAAWQTSEGVDGLVPNGSLGEYEALSNQERAQVVEATIEGADTKAEVVPGVSGKTATEAVHWTEHAAKLGCAGVMCLPPTSHAPTHEEVLAHYREVASVGIPVIAYNNPFSTRIDLVPELLAQISEIDGIVGVKEFSGDIRRIAHIRELAADFQVIAGADDVVVEGALMGATGWIAGFVNAFPAQSVRLWSLTQAQDWDAARALYREMLPIMRWDADPRFVQAIKLGQEEAGRYGGPVRLPRLPLSADDEKTVRAAARRALAATSQ